LLAAGVITLPAVAATATGRITVLTLVAVFVVSLSATLLASAAGLRLIHLVDGSPGVSGRRRSNDLRQAEGDPGARRTVGATAPGPAAAAVTLGRLPIARVPADQAIDGRVHTDRSGALPIAPIVQPTDQDPEMPPTTTTTTTTTTTQELR